MNADALAAAKSFAFFHAVHKHPALSKEARAGYIAALCYADRRAPRVLQAMRTDDLVALIASVLP